MKFEFRKAEMSDFEPIWEIISDAKESRRLEGSSQWQDGYPNEDSIRNDIQNHYGFVMTYQGIIYAYSAVIFAIEPAYEAIEGQWITDGEYAVVHRMAVARQAKGKGIGKILLEYIENYILEKKYPSIRIDTNFDNIAMLKILEKEEYVYCGEVYFRGSARKAFEKKIK
ncbi:MAG: GNAT family N-acetyltransferase [Capnocytophaga sp.]|nr:GNAT family N-acetyltransferase [Capnocytophaga sp.]